MISIVLGAGDMMVKKTSHCLRGTSFLTYKIRGECVGGVGRG